METTGKPIEILLVEDNPADVRLTVEILKETKVRNTLTVAGDGDEALDLLRRTGNIPTPCGQTSFCST